MLVRTLGGAMGTAALVLAGAGAPAMAHGDYHHRSHEVKVLVCARFDDHHHHGDSHDYGDHQGDESLKVSVRTDRDSDYAQLQDRQCAKFELDFRAPWLKVWTWPSNDGHVDFKVFGDDEFSFSHDNWLKVKFDDEVRDPFVGVIANVEDSHNHDYGGDHSQDYSHQG